jgi:hypothetical protein
MSIWPMVELWIVIQCWLAEDKKAATGGVFSLLFLPCMHCFTIMGACMGLSMVCMQQHAISAHA